MIRLGSPLELGAGDTLTVRAASITVRGLPDNDELERVALTPGSLDVDAPADLLVAEVGAPR
jgi:hypothetical protein